MSKKYTPEELATKWGQSEHSHQVAFFCWTSEVRDKYVGIDLAFAIPNGGERNRAVAGQMKAEGVKAGVLDVFIPVPKGKWHGCWIEFKFGRNIASKEQLGFAERVYALGYYTALVYSWTEATKVVDDYWNSI